MATTLPYHFHGSQHVRHIKNQIQECLLDKQSLIHMPIQRHHILFCIVSVHFHSSTTKYSLSSSQRSSSSSASASSSSCTNTFCPTGPSPPMSTYIFCNYLPRSCSNHVTPISFSRKSGEASPYMSLDAKRLVVT